MASTEAFTEQVILDGTCAVVVTYGHRLAFVQQVLHAAFQAGVGHVVLVDNGTDPSVAASLKTNVAAWGAERASILRLDHNGGSSEGFAAGIAAAAQRAQTRFIWTLDDDTVAQPDTLQALARTWLLMGENSACCLASFRQDKRTYIKLAEKNKPNVIQPNSFFGFSVQAPFQKKTVAIWKKDGLDCRGMAMGAYGGLWFPKEWVQRIGLPDRRFFLYFDDYDYTLRITRHGGALWMCRNSVLKDIEQSWTQTISPLHPWIQGKEGMLRTYFTVRNRVFVEQGSVECKAIYYLNVVLFLLIKVLCRTPRSVVCHILHPIRMMRRWRVLLGAVQDGLSGNFENRILKS